MVFSGRWWLVLVTALLGTAVILLRIATLYSGSWAVISTETSRLQMDLKGCVHCEEGQNAWSWGCFQAHYCGLTEENSLCEVFSSGSTASFSVKSYLVPRP